MRNLHLQQSLKPGSDQAKSLVQRHGAGLDPDDPVQVGGTIGAGRGFLAGMLKFSDAIAIFIWCSAID